MRDEGFEHGRVVVCFGVPLASPTRKDLAGLLDRLDRAVIGPRDCRKVTGETLDGLVMMGGHVSFVQPSTLWSKLPSATRTRCLGHRARRRAVLLMADDVREVLDERAA